MPRQTAFTPVSSSLLLNVYAAEIERVVSGTFGSLTNLSRPRFLVARSTDLTGISSATDTTITWQTVVSDPRSMWSAGVPNVVTVKDAGDWVLFGQQRWGGSSASRVGKTLKNGTNPNVAGVTQSSVTMLASTAAEGTTMGVFALTRCAVNDLLYFSGWQNSGSAQSLLVDFGGTYFGGVWLGP
jgi:hypothetical protein